MAGNEFGHLDTDTLKKRRKRYNLYTIAGMVVVLGGIALFTIDKERYDIVFYSSMAFYLILMYSFRTWAIKMKKELQRRGEL